MAGNPYSGGPQIGGLYDSNLKAALTEQATKAGERNATKQSFASLLSTGITAANTARVAQANRVAQEERNNARITAQDERMREQKKLEFDNNVKMEQEKRKQQYDDVGNVYKELNTINKEEQDPEVALSRTYNVLRTGYKISGSDVLADDLMQLLGLDDRDQLDAHLAGKIPLNFAGSAADAIRNTIKLNKEKAEAEKSKVVAEGKKAELENEQTSSLLSVNKLIDTKMTNIVETKTETDEERTYVESLNGIRANIQNKSKETRKAVDEAYAELVLNGRNTVEVVDEHMTRFQDVLAKINAAGGTVDFKSVPRSIIQKILGGESEEASRLLTGMTADDFIISGSSITQTERDRLASEAMASLNILMSRANLLGKTVLGQTGVQTDRDFLNNMKAMLDLGNDLPTMMLSLETGKNIFRKSAFEKSMITGYYELADVTLAKMHEDGYTLNHRGELEDPLDIEYRILNMHNGDPEHILQRRQILEQSNVNNGMMQFTNQQQNGFVETPELEERGLFDG